MASKRMKYGGAKGMVKGAKAIQSCATHPRYSKPKAVAGRAKLRGDAPGRQWLYSKVPTSGYANTKGL